MFRAHVTKVSVVLLLTLALGAVSAPAQAAGASPERSSRWEQVAQSFIDWLLNCSGSGGPAGKAEAAGKALHLANPGTIDRSDSAALCFDTSSCIDPDGRH